MPYDPAVLLLGIYTKELKAGSHVHNNIIHSRQKVEATLVSINGWMDKQSLYTYNRILFSLKKEENSDTCYSVDEPWGHYAKWNKLVTKRYYK